jgi:hypothetical protein
MKKPRLLVRWQISHLVLAMAVHPVIMVYGIAGSAAALFCRVLSGEDWWCQGLFRALGSGLIWRH